MLNALPLIRMHKHDEITLKLPRIMLIAERSKRLDLFEVLPSNSISIQQQNKNI